MLYEDILEMIGSEVEDWEGDDVSLTCPHGHRIEPHAYKCADGCINPLITFGFI